MSEKLTAYLKKINFKVLSAVFYWFVIGILAITAAVTVISALNIPGGIKLYTIQTGSMSPSISTGSVVLIKHSEKYKEGDVITFKSATDRLNNTSNKTTTHRIYKVQKNETGTQYITKGDANPSPDSNPANEKFILGRVAFSVPLLGYPVAFAKTIPGLILLIIIPATTILYGEILNIKKEIGLIFERRRKNENKAY